ncbi:Aste57867_8735 [Aphanomyces stellatus]|uniref:Aste57867_8735 protein n=1 Tax=Aphanomyces stellatus TaxID=120398 RepID=A0A485KL68_9STRA|nr:hypothetical protein As57867_008701 [Aphanomyces stellatus]VFT85621.1 Aste57867_8735 [Aphanomyces stellatus]
MTKGSVLYAILGNSLWGVGIIYWKQLAAVPPIEVLAHRFLWSFLLALGLIVAQSEWPAFRDAAFHRSTLATYAFSGLLLGINLFFTVWAAATGYVVQLSLGFFISPLVNVLLGVVVLNESLRQWQIFSVALATAGVAVVAVANATCPWLALTVAATFGVFGLVKKQAPLPSLHGMTLELGIFFFPALVYLVVIEANGSATFLRTTTAMDVYLVGSSVATVAPLVLYSAAAKHIPLTLLGILQYTAPSIQFLVGVLIFHEQLPLQKLIGFVCVWTGLVVFGVESICHSRPATPEANNSIAFSFDRIATPHCGYGDETP